MPQVAPDGVRFVLAVQAAWADGRAVALPPLLSLSWSRGGDDGGALAAPQIGSARRAALAVAGAAAAGRMRR